MTRRALPQEILFLVFALAAALLSLSLSPVAEARFRIFALGLPPAAALALAGAVGALALYTLRRLRFFPHPTSTTPLRASLLAAGLATAFLLPIAAIDIALPFPADVNLPWPDAWAFYPAIAPLPLAAFLLAPAAAVFALTRRAPGAILLAALVEPAFQMAFDMGTGLSPRTALMGLHIFALSLVQLWLLRRHGLAAMLSFRLVYYLHWHILWGQLRLSLLF